jgi:hypothetical protein
MAVVIFLFFAIVVGLYLYGRHHAKVALEEAIAETDRVDPEWRLDVIKKLRSALPPEQNAAVPLRAAAALIQGTWSPRDLDSERPNRQLDPKRFAALRDSVQQSMPGAVVARQALALKSGWYPLEGFDTRPVINLGTFLAHLAMFQSQSGDGNEACETALIILAVARSFGEYPTFIQFAGRTRLSSLAVASLERCLAQGKASDDSLVQAQQFLADEADQPVLFHALRVDRAGMHAIMTDLESGRVSMDAVWASNVSNSFQYEVVKTQLLVTGRSYETEHAWRLWHSNEGLRYAKLPAAEMLAQMRGLDKKRQDTAGPLAEMITLPLTGFAEKEASARAQLECALVAVAVERFRIQQGRWPDSLEEVVAAKLLANIPADPYDGKPVRYRKASDGVVVYSIGRSGNYTGDALDAGKAVSANNPRPEFRLWDEQQRGQPPQAKSKVDD